MGDRPALPAEPGARDLRSGQWEKALQALNRAGKAINGPLDTREALENLCRECGKLLGASWVTLWKAQEGVLSRPLTWPPGSPPIHAVNGSGAPGSLDSLPTLLSARVASSGMAEVWGHTSEVSSEPPARGSRGPLSVMAVPLVAGDRVIGVLEIGHHGPGRPFTRHCMETGEAFAALAAAALQNARLSRGALEEKERSAHLIAQLNAVLKEVDAGVLLVNDCQQVLWMNPKFGEMFAIGDTESIVKDGAPAPMSALRDRDRGCFADPDAFFAQRDRLDADREYAGYLEDLEILRPVPRTLQEFTTPVHDAQGDYIGRLWVYHDVTVQKRTEEALRRSEAQHRAILEAVPDAMFRIRRDGTYLDYIAPTDSELFVPAEEFLGKGVSEVMPAEVARQSLEGIQEALSSRQAQTLVYQLRMNDRVRDYEARLVACGEDEVLAIVRDVTERNFLQGEFLQSQKLESLGRLAGGIAHDFNNLLAGIMGYASLLRGKLDPSSEAYEFAGIIELATQRGAQLTRQLLTAARKSPVAVRPVDMTGVMQEVVLILSRTLPKNITVEARLLPRLPLVQGDQTQIHQVLMNLSVNAADAMPDGGVLTLSGQEVQLDDAFCQKHLSVQPGPYVRLEVSDTGVGIGEADQPKIFDPFFTTKEPGKGTGLGLAVVYAIVKNHQGLIEVASTPNQGSVFTVYLPVAHPQSS